VSEAIPDPIDAVTHALFALMRPSAPPPGEQGTELTMSQLRVLFRLRHGGPATMGEIARFADCSLQSATALIERVGRRGLVTRERREDDRRVVECRLTDAGHRLVDEIAGHRAASVRAALSTLDPDELDQLQRLLLAMLDRLGRPLPRHDQPPPRDDQPPPRHDQPPPRHDQPPPRHDQPQPGHPR
jgi:DNA-binding MarR family transcriptional regulator